MKRVEIVVVSVLAIMVVNTAQAGMLAVVPIGGTAETRWFDEPGNYYEYGVFTVDFGVYSLGDEAWIQLSSTGVHAPAMTYLDEIKPGSLTTTIQKVSGGGWVSGDYLQIHDGERANLRVTGYFTPQQTGLYALKLDQILYSNISATTSGAKVFDLSAAGDSFRSPLIYINGVPDPTTLVLLGASSVMLAKRRRRG